MKIVKKAKVTKLIQENGKIVGVHYERDGKPVSSASDCGLEELISV